MSLRALQDYTFVSKYARYNKEQKRRETWNEAVDRVFDMHTRRYPQLTEELEWAKKQVIQKRVLGSQRALQFGGEPVEKKNARLYNCCASYCDRLRFFQESFWLLLCGCGVGFSVQRHHVAKLPELTQPEILYEDWSKKTFVIPDTIEGWADSLGVLISSFMQHGVFPEYEGANVVFDYSQIREEGASLSSSSGKAPGPMPLRNALEKIRQILIRCYHVGQKRLLPIDAYDIVMHASDAVLSGGVRRSATICLFSPDDMVMAKAKTGNWFTENPQRGRSNNSALLIRNETSFEQFRDLIGLVREFGEPGFVWADSTELIVNPCVTADTMVATTDGLRSVTDLLGERFVAVIEGKTQASSEKGFWLTGKKKIIHLEFASGRVLKLTPSHKLLTTYGWKEAGELEADDEVVIHNHRLDVQGMSWIDDRSKNYSRGYCLGHLLGDGNVTHSNSAEMKWWGDKKEEYRKDGLLVLERARWLNSHHKSDSKRNSPNAVLESKMLYQFADTKGCFEGKKHLSQKALSGSLDYLAGIAAGYFDADGTVAVNHKKGCSLRYTSTSMDNLRHLQIILNRFGIFSKIYRERYPEGWRKLPDGNGGHKQYYCKATHELCISCDSIHQFHRLIPLRNEEKIAQIEEIVEGYKRCPNRTHFVDKVVNKTNGGMEHVYDCAIPEIHAFDANGVYAHNCVEVGMYAYDIDTGLSGWQMCNLCEINGKKCKTPEDFAIASRAAAIIGTVQAGYTDMAYLGPITKKILEREALLGVSITGMMDAPDILFDTTLQKKNAKLILKVNKEIAVKIGINPTARATVVKPAGTTSCMLGTASGIHPHHAERYIRRSQANWMEPPLQFFKSKNPRAVEKSVWSENGTDEVIAFCVDIADCDTNDTTNGDNTKSCDLHSDNPIGWNLSGLQLGKWHVTNKTKQVSGKRYWYCECDCGTGKWVWHGNLQGGSSRSCGCLKKRKGSRNPHWKGHGDISAKKWKHIQIHADDRNISFEISIVQAWEVFVKQKKRCALTGLPIDFGKNSTASLDRIDSGKNYTIDNIQWLHKTVNKMKWNIPQNEFIQFCELVARKNFVSFDKSVAKTKNDIDAITLLDHVKSTQQNWVLPGTRKERCVHDWLTHNVSNTIHVRDDEWDTVTDYIYDNRKYFCGIALLSITGDKDYPQAPFCAIYTPRELVQMYGDASVMASGLIVDGLHVFENLWVACEAALGLGVPIEEPVDPETTEVSVHQQYLVNIGKYKAKLDWMRRSEQFAERYFDGDTKKMTYCLKDINNWKLWCDLQRECVDVDYTEMIEETDNTKLSDTQACAGGACDVNYA